MTFIAKVEWWDFQVEVRDTGLSLEMLAVNEPLSLRSALLNLMLNGVIVE